MNFTDLQIPFDEAENYFKPNNKEKLNRLFYKNRNYNKLLNDTTYFLIGEKGSGKTTYCAYFCNNNVNNTRSRRYPISVDDYNKIIQMKKDGKLNYTHYVTLWKAILLIKLLSTIEEDEVSFRGVSAMRSIKKTLDAFNFTKITMDTFSPVSFMDNIKFSMQGGFEASDNNAKFNSGTNATSENQTSMQKHVYEDNWQKFINIIASELERLRLKKNHYLFVDGIDTRPTDISYAEYTECIYPLVRAVYDLNNDILSHVKDRAKGRLQIVLLTRLDIFLNAGLSNAGSKISDNSAFLNWSMTNEKQYSSTDLYKLVQKMLSAPDSKESPWKQYFNFTIDRGSKSLDSFAYFLRLSTSKPRDFVKILKITKEQCEAHGIQNPTAKIIESDLFQRAYSTYFVDTLRTALSFYYDENEIKLFFDFIRSFNSCFFNYARYQGIWQEFASKEQLHKTFGEPFELLELMFDFNLIAVVEEESYYRWKYRECTIANYDYGIEKNAVKPETNFMFHWAAEKEFGLYLK